MVSFGPGEAIQGPKRTRIPDFDRLVVRCGHDLGPVWGKCHPADPIAVGAGLLSLELECGCEGRQKQSAFAKEGRFWARNAPASQTLIVLSSDPDTILVPSGENATDLIQSLWAFVFSVFSSSVPAREARNRQIWPRRGNFGPNSHLSPRL